MAYKYQALNSSRTSLTSVSSLGSSRSIDSARQQPRLEFSAAGNSSTRNLLANSCAEVVMATNVERDGCSFTIGEAETLATGGVSRSVTERPLCTGKGGGGEMERAYRYVEERDGVFDTLEPATGMVGGRRERPSVSPASMSEEQNENEPTSQSTASGKGPMKERESEFVHKAAQSDQKTLHAGVVESETGLYIHSSVLSARSGSLRFSRHGSVERQSAPSHGTRNDHGKLFKVLQRFSTKRAQQREEEEAEKRAKKSPQHVGAETDGGLEGRDKENVSHWHKGASHKTKHGKKGHFPVSKSNDLLSSGFSDVVCCGEDSSEFDVSTSASTEGLLHMCERHGGDDDLSTCGLSHADPQHRYGHCGRDRLEVGGSCRHGDVGGSSGSSRKYRVRRSSSLSEKVRQSCDATDVDTAAMATRRTLPAANLSRNYSDAKYRKKLHVPFSHFRNRHS